MNAMVVGDEYVLPFGSIMPTDTLHGTYLGKLKPSDDTQTEYVDDNLRNDTNIDNRITKLFLFDSGDRRLNPQNYIWNVQKTAERQVGNGLICDKLFPMTDKGQQMYIIKEIFPEKGSIRIYGEYPNDRFPGIFGPNNFAKSRGEFYLSYAGYPNKTNDFLSNGAPTTFGNRVKSAASRVGRTLGLSPKRPNPDSVAPSTGKGGNRKKTKRNKPANRRRRVRKSRRMK
jgi:hypothetical protein